MPIKQFDGGTVITGREIELARLLSLRGRIHLEMIWMEKFGGSPGGNLARFLRVEFGLKPRAPRAALLARIEDKLAEEWNVPRKYTAQAEQ